MKVLSEKASKGATVDIKDLMANFTMDVIGTCAFGLEINSINNPENMFKKIGKEIFPQGFDNSLWLKTLANFAFPNLQDIYR